MDAASPLLGGDEDAHAVEVVIAEAHEAEGTGHAQQQQEDENKEEDDDEEEERSRAEEEHSREEERRSRDGEERSRDDEEPRSRAEEDAHARGDSATSARKGSKLWVSNLAKDLQQADLAAIFERYGHVLSLDWKNRFAIVELDTEEAARTAMLELNGVKLLDTPMHINVYRDRSETASGNAHELTPSASMPEPRPGEGRIYVRNLDYRTSWQDLKDAFQSHGDVYRANILAIDGRPSGRGQVIFHRLADAEAVVRRFPDGIDLRPRRVLLTLDVGTYDRNARFRPLDRAGRDGTPHTAAHGGAKRARIHAAWSAGHTRQSCRCSRAASCA